MKLPLSAVAGIVFLAAAGAVFYHSYRLATHRWTVFTQPIRLEEGFALSQPFTVEIPTKYWVSVSCRRAVPIEILDTALTRDFVGTFSVDADGTRVAQGEVSGSSFGTGTTDSEYELHLGEFKAAPGPTYQLTLRVARSLPPLATTSPTAKISVHPYVYKEAYVGVVLSALLAKGLAVVGIICLLVTLWRFLSLRRRADRS